MKIKLIYSPKYSKNIPYAEALGNAALPPLGIASITAALRDNGYKCCQDDLNIKVIFDNAPDAKKSRIDLSIFEDRPRVKKFLKEKHDSGLEEEAEKILKKTKYKNFDLVGFSILEEVNLSSMSIPLVLSKVIKEKTGAEVIVGGVNYPRPVTELKDFLESGLIDYVIMNAGEEPLLNLCYALENGCLDRFSVQNVFSKKIDNKRPVLNKVENSVHFPRPDFSGLPLNLYRFKAGSDVHKSSITVLALPYVFVKGCRYNCVFCPASKTKDFLINDIVKVVDDLKYLSKKYKTKYFFFANSTINPSYEYAEMFVNEMKKEDVNILWADCANFNGMDSKLLNGLKQVGATKLLFGIESSSKKMQKYILKNIDIKKAGFILKESHGLGIWNELELIAGMPYETDKDIHSTVKFIRKNKAYLNYCYLNTFRLVDSLLLQNPEHFGISNIKNSMRTSSDVKWFSRTFDETKGLKWKEKRKQILRSYAFISKEIDLQFKKGFSYFPASDTRLLFYLYSLYGNKQDVVNYFKTRSKNNHEGIEH